MIGETIGNYRVLSLLGSGGMGEVYLAEQLAIETRVAIKILQTAISKDEEQVKRFFNEARASNKVRHAGPVKIFDVGFHKGHAYLVMEHLEGESLAARIRRLGVLPGDQVADIGRQIAGVLEAVHAAGITHRDLKPDNIFLVPDSELPSGERVKVLDFGIAKLSGTMSGHSPQTKGTMGTPAYMAPEQWNNSATVDSRADTYSLGCVMYEMAVGKPPFPANSVGEACTHHLHSKPPRASELVPQVPGEFDTLVDRMLAKTADQRPTLKEVSRTFEHLRSSGATQRWTSPGFAVNPGLQATLIPSLIAPSHPNAMPPPPSQPYPAQPSQPYPVQPTPQYAPSPTTMPRGEAPPPPVKKSKALVFALAGVVVAGGITTAAILAGGEDDKRKPKVIVDAAVATADVIAETPPPIDAPALSARERLAKANPFRDYNGVTLLTHQLTAGEYVLVTGKQPPVTQVEDRALAWLSQAEAAAVCAQIDARLPTSDEWTKAAQKAWGIGTPPGPLQEWTSTLQDELVVVRGGHSTMPKESLERAARQNPPYFLQKEAGDAATDRNTVAGAMIGVRCADGPVPTKVAEPPKPKPSPPPKTPGTLSREQISHPIGVRSGAIRMCYERALRRNPNAQGKVEVSFVIDQDGRVASVTAKSFEAQLGVCIERIVRTMQFAKPQGGGSVAVKYPFVFKPDN